jgi:acetyl esterase/lipase
MSLANLQRHVMRLHKSGQTDEAWRLADESRGRYTQTAMSALWLAELRWRLTYDVEAAFQELVRAQSNGDWWARELLLAQPFLEALAGREDFESLVAECERMKETAQAEVRAEKPHVHPPRGRPRGLLLVLHGRSGRLPNSARPWEVAAEETGMVVAAPRGSRLSSSDATFDWPDPVDAIAEVTHDYASVVAEHRLQGKPVVIAGFSRGARLAISWSLAGDIPTRGFIAVCPVMRNTADIRPHIPAAVADGTRGVLLAGEWDWAHDRTMTFADELKRGGLEVKSAIMKGVDHGYPDDFAERLTDALDFVMRKRDRSRWLCALTGIRSRGGPSHGPTRPHC